MPGQRADARRNYALVLAVAEREVAVHGAAASLEQIARTAGVGSATVRRHFPTRAVLLEAVSRSRIQTLSELARARATDVDARSALVGWLFEVMDYCVSARGLAVALNHDSTGTESANTCSMTLEAAATPLLVRAVGDGSVRSDTTLGDLITLIVGIALATEHSPNSATQAKRLLRLALLGLGQEPGPALQANEPPPPSQLPASIHRDVAGRPDR